MRERTTSRSLAFGALLGLALGLTTLAHAGDDDECGGASGIDNGATGFSTIGYGTDGPEISGDGSPEEGDCNDFGDPQIHNDRWYDYNSTFNGDLIVSTCDQADYDTKIAIYEGCACPVTNDRLIGCNDDGPGCGGFTSDLTVSVTSGSCYKIRVGGFGDDDTGTGTLSIAKIEDDCQLECRVFEDEPCGADENGGCNSDPPAFDEIECDVSVCGTTWADGGFRDTDWYLIDVPDPDGDGMSQICGRVTSVMPTVCFIVDVIGDGECDGAVQGEVGCGFDCGNEQIAYACVPAPGTYAVFVAPGTCDGGGVFDGYPCETIGNTNDYKLEVSVTNCGDECGGCLEDDDCPWDFSGDGNVGPEDLAKLLDNWGPCPGDPKGDCNNPGVCKTYELCGEVASDCVCFTLFDGSGWCGFGISCDGLQACPNGDCPPGYVCQVETCCPDGNICAPMESNCDYLLDPPVFEPFEWTTVGQADENGIVDVGGAAGGGGGEDPPCNLRISQEENEICMAYFSQWDLAQSFTAVNENSCGAGFDLFDFDPEPTVAVYTISLWDALPNAGGTMLASGQGGSVDGKVDIFWESVSIEIGQVYFLVFESDEAGILECVAGSLSNPYDGGHVYANPGFQPYPFYDYTFRHYGKDDAPGECKWDFTGNGVVGPEDLAKLLDNWGQCPGMEPPKGDCEPGECDDFPVCGDFFDLCFCVSLFDGSGFCVLGGLCGPHECPDGECPPGTICLVDTCCGPTNCAFFVLPCPHDGEGGDGTPPQWKPFAETIFGVADENGYVYP